MLANRVEEGKKAVFSVVIVSPLLSLMDKQVEELVQRGQSYVLHTSSRIVGIVAAACPFDCIVLQLRLYVFAVVTCKV